MKSKKKIPVFWACGVFLVAVLALLVLLDADRIALMAVVAGCVALLLAAAWSYRRQERYLDRIVQDETWETACQGKEWSRIPFHHQLEAIVQGNMKETRNQDAQRAMEQYATLQALQSQINPHFLYNTLECIRGQALMDGNRDVAKMLEALGNFFQYSISRKENVVPLFDEIENVKGYMLIQNYRFSNRFRLEIDFMEDEEQLAGCYVPKLMLQPLVENALLHGFENRTGGTVRLVVDASDNMLLLTVSDDGEGMAPAALCALNDRISGKVESPQPTKSHGNGIALPNINRRIQMLFGKEYSLHAYSTVGRGTDMEIVLPRITRPEVEL